ncbi:hypothetical protein ABH944_005559 [Caballeronia udeis]|uniref:Uncharacterized protein n=1 Tax=Caballeronia udeis TaxID=1232866 RepID=A0ABW8MRS7_9BURK
MGTCLCGKQKHRQPVAQTDLARCADIQDLPAQHLVREIDPFDLAGVGAQLGIFNHYTQDPISAGRHQLEFVPAPHDCQRVIRYQVAVDQARAVVFQWNAKPAGIRTNLAGLTQRMTGRFTKYRHMLQA